MIALLAQRVYNMDVPPEQRCNGFFVSNLIPVDRQSPVSERQQRKPLHVFLAEHLRDRALPLNGGCMPEQKTIARKWTLEEDETLKQFYLEKERTEIGEMLGRTPGSIRKRCSVLGLNYKRPFITQDTFDLIRAWYSDPARDKAGDLSLDELAEIVGMEAGNVSRVARKMGLTKSRKLNDKRIEDISKNTTERIRKNGHPKGMLGKHHSEQFKAFMSENVKGRVFTEEQTRLRTERQIKTKIERYGTGRPAWLNSHNPYSRTKSGKRDDLGGQFFRSSWEANYARYLNHLIGTGAILSWRFESRVFVFDGVFSGVCTYTPDFEIVTIDGLIEWHEVKGWMDENSKIRISRMAEYYPSEKLIVIGRKEYEAIEKEYHNLPNWEQSRKVTP